MRIPESALTAGHRAGAGPVPAASHLTASKPTARKPAASKPTAGPSIKPGAGRSTGTELSGGDGRVDVSRPRPVTEHSPSTEHSPVPSQAAVTRHALVTG